MQYQNRFKLQDTIEERHGLRGTHLNIPMLDLVEMNQTNFSSTDIFVIPVNESHIQVPTNDYRLKNVIAGTSKIKHLACTPHEGNSTGARIETYLS
ncbi:hypothetical protein [Rickettsiella endosymbiont of Xylota segnis]|uniref:hypothetical protein n=1 Tax=Rickettsiella endosymbiont of Xylota segnis TaxID=3066238 RepID=UPI0030D423BB